MASVPQKSPADILDPSVLTELRGIVDDDGTPLLEKYIQLYLESAQNNSQNIQYAIVIGETETLFEQAHSLKSASANLGARALADTCQVLENAGKNHDIDLAKQYLAFFKTQFHQTINALQDELGKGTSSSILPEIEFSSAKENAICSAHILVVDDDPGFHLITSEHLIKSGFSISKAYSGNEALELMDLQKPDLIILDAIMEDLDGFETCRAIKANSMMSFASIFPS